jgi:hypothetical protein|tara:strand:- start:216 stop:506 length:291 start_codon:yes stop_codon:yes gene_type:complete
MNTKLINYLNKNNIDLKLNKYNALEILDNNKFLNFMKNSPLSYNIIDEIKNNYVDNIFLLSNSMVIKINIIKDDNLFKSWYYDLEPIIKLSENKSL